MKSHYIVVEGPLGVGKGMLVKTLEREFSARAFLDEPNPFLSSFYRDMEKYAFQLQLYFLLNRFTQQKALAQGDLFASPLICDYLFHKNRLFASLTLDRNEYGLYEKVYGLLKGTIATPDVVLYLQADVDTLLDRISQKNEDVALLLPEPYLRKVVEAYHEFFFHYVEAPVIVLNTVKTDYTQPGKELDLLVRKIREVRTGVHYLNPEEK